MSSAAAQPAAAASTCDYTVTAAPHPHLVYTNHVYVSDDGSNAALLTLRAGQPDTFVRINDTFVYACRAHESVSAGHISLSSLQRESCRLSMAERTRVEPWTLPTDSADLVSLRLDVELIGRRKANVVAAELALVLVKSFVGQVFTRGQVFCCDFQGAALKLTVKADSSGGEGQGVFAKELTQGMLHKDTRLELTAMPCKFLTFNAEASPSAT